MLVFTSVTAGSKSKLCNSSFCSAGSFSDVSEQAQVFRDLILQIHHRELTWRSHICRSPCHFFWSGLQGRKERESILTTYTKHSSQSISSLLWGLRCIPLILKENWWYSGSLNPICMETVFNICHPETGVNAFLTHEITSRMNSSFFPWQCIYKKTVQEVANLVCPTVLSLINSSITGFVQFDFRQPLV